MRAQETLPGQWVTIYLVDQEAPIQVGTCAWADMTGLALEATASRRSLMFPWASVEHVEVGR